MTNSSFIWSDGWWVEDNIAWFVDGEHSILYSLDMNTGGCDFIAQIPNNKTKCFRLNPRCIKIEKEIYCIPDVGDRIWVYHLEKDEFVEIEIRNINHARLGIINFWIDKNTLYVVSRGLGQIIEVDIQGKKVSKYYDLEDEVKESTKVDDAILCVSASSGCVYEFNIVTKRRTKYVLPIQVFGLNTICFDGENFWFSGNRKEIYVWNKEKNTLKVLNQFPESFGIYYFDNNVEGVVDCDLQQYEIPTFITSVFVGKHIWFIPFKTNKIIYVDKGTLKINTLEIPEEEESEVSLAANRLKHKYLLQYILNNRYIGLYSLKNGQVFEIDTIDKTVSWKDCFISDESIGSIVNALVTNNQHFMEGAGIDSLVYKKVIEKSYVDDRKMQENVGQMIYQKTK